MVEKGWVGINNVIAFTLLELLETRSHEAHNGHELIIEPRKDPELLTLPFPPPEGWDYRYRCVATCPAL